MIAPITTHAQDALARLTSAYDTAVRARALVAVFAQGVQAIEDALVGVRQDQLAQGGPLGGAALDVLGRLVGLSRDGLDDATYYVLLLGKIAENTSDGATSAVLAVAQQIFQAQAVFLADANAPVHAAQSASAQVQLALGSPQTDSALFALLIRLVSRTLAAGVSVASIATFDSQGCFAFAGPQPWVRGFAALDGTGGGPMAQLIYSDPSETP